MSRFISHILVFFHLFYFPSITDNEATAAHRLDGMQKEYNDKLRRQLTKSLNGYRRIEKGINEALKALNDMEQAQETDILT